jgi:hypothetical protein
MFCAFEQRDFARTLGCAGGLVAVAALVSAIIAALSAASSGHPALEAYSLTIVSFVVPCGEQ